LMLLHGQHLSWIRLILRHFFWGCSLAFQMCLCGILYNHKFYWSHNLCLHHTVISFQLQHRRCLL
jgi:hypothetical protein